MRYLLAGLTAVVLAVGAFSGAMLMAATPAKADVCETLTLDAVKAKLQPQAKVMEVSKLIIAPLLAQFGAAVPPGATRMFFIQTDDRGLILMTDETGCAIATSAGSAKGFYAALARVEMAS